MTPNLRRAATSVLASIWLMAAGVGLHEGCSGLASPHDGDSGLQDAAEDGRARDATLPGDAATDGKGRDAKSAGDARDRGDGKDNDGGVDASVDCREGGPPTLVDLRFRLVTDASTPLTLVPPFSSKVFDYYVRCVGMTNAIEVSMTASACAESSLTEPTKSRSLPRQTVSANVTVNQAIVAQAADGTSSTQYWVRCLPPDFPAIHLDAHPEAGTPVPGYYLVGNFSAGGPLGGYAMVLNGNGVPVWYYRNPTGGVSNVDNQVDGGISFLQVGPGPITLVDIGPPLKTILSAPGDAPIDFHELRILANGDYLIISSPIRTGVDLTGLDNDAGGPDASVVDCNILEFDPTTSIVNWSWSALAHFDPVKDSIHPIEGAGRTDAGVFATGWDVFHCNAIDVDPSNGNLLVSARQTDSVSYVDKKTGEVLWKMGGASNASLDNATYVPVANPFNGQHDPRLQPGWSTCSGGQISLFDDETYGTGTSARGLVYDVKVSSEDGGCDAGTPGATVAWIHTGTGGPSGAEGSHRVASDGSHLIGWGLRNTLIFTELDSAGHDLLDLYSGVSGPPAPMESYRAIKVPTTALDLNSMRATAGGP
jgi:Arylsulfotransferase (ASST)